MKIKMLSYNIHKGFSWSGGNLIIDQIKKAVKETDVDLVLLQEIIGKHKGHEKKYCDWPDQTQYEYLADTIWTDYAYAKNSVYTDGHHGNAILSKYPIHSWYQFDISNNAWEQRGILHCQIKIPVQQISATERFLHIYCLHLDLFHGGRVKQYQSVLKRIEKDVKEKDSVIVAGDFNDWNKKSHEVFENILQMQEVFKIRQGDYAKTFPAKFPVLPLDRIYVKNLTINDVRIFKDDPWKGLSDHVPLFCELEIPYET